MIGVIVGMVLLFAASATVLFEPYFPAIQQFIPLVPWLIFGGSISLSFGLIKNLIIALLVGFILGAGILVFGGVL